MSRLRTTEGLAHLRVDDEVDVAPPVARLDVLEAVPLLGQRPQRLGEELELLHGDGQLAGARPEQVARDADEVADVEVGEGGERVAERVGPRVELDAARRRLADGRSRSCRGAGAPSPGPPAPPRPPRAARPRPRPCSGAWSSPAPVGDGKAPAERVDAAGPPALELLDPAADLLVGIGGQRRGRSGHAYAADRAIAR